MEPRGDIAALDRARHCRIEQDRVLAVDLEHPAVPAHDPHGLEQSLIGQPEVEDHERLGRGNARIDGGGQLGHGVVGTPADGQAQPVVDRTVVFRRRSPFVDTGPQRALCGRR